MQLCTNQLDIYPQRAHGPPRNGMALHFLLGTGRAREMLERVDADGTHGV